HGRWLMYRRAGAPGVFRGFEWLRLLPPRIRRSWRVTRQLTRLVERRGVRGYFNLYDVPREELACFDLPQREDIFEPGGLPCGSIWDTLRRRDVQWSGWNWRTPDSVARASALDAITRGRDDFVFLYSATLDARLHHEGSRGAGVAAELAAASTGLDDAAAAARRAGREPWLYLFSDHGMVDVTGTVDVMSRLARLPWRRGRDYLAFFDSTMARFWWRAPAPRHAIRRALAAAPPGRSLTPADLVDAGADFADHRYGEDLYLVDPGVLIVPSFMGLQPVAAMHGYDPAHPDMAGFLAANRPLPAEVARLADLRGFLEREL